MDTKLLHEEPNGDDFLDVARLARRVAEAKAVLIGFESEGHVRFAGRPDLQTRELEFAAELCRRMLDGGDRLEISDLKREPNLEVPQPETGLEPLQFYFGVVVPGSPNEPRWFLAVMDRSARRLRNEQRVGIETLGQQIFLRHEQRRNVAHLAQRASELERAEAARREHEAFYQALVESLPHSIFRKDLAGKFTFANKRFAATLACSHEEILGRNDYDFSPPELARKYQEDDRKVLSERKALEVTEVHVTPDGVKHWVHVIKTPILDETGELVGIQGIFWDVTAEKRAEERLARAESKYRSIFENALDGIFQTSADGQYLSANPALARIYGFNSPEELIERCTDIAHQLYLDPSRRDEFRRLMAEKGQVDQFESEVRR